MTLKFCLSCRGHHRSGEYCAEAERRRYLVSQERRIRGSARWKKARAAARQRDGNRCRHCGSTRKIEVHHVVSLAQGGDRFALSNLITLCRDCHHAGHRGDTGSTGNALYPPRASNPRNKPEPQPRFSRSTLKNVGDHEVPFV